ncbi:MAG: TIGR03435 family protein [Bryobacteraceae bacterium]
MLPKSKFWNPVTSSALPLVALISASASSLAPCLSGLAPPLTAMQVEPTGPLQFDVASLKLAADQNQLEARPRRSVGRFRWNTMLLNMLSYAYHMDWWRISDTPGLTDIYALEATMPPNSTQDQVRLMLQDLLVERFHLEVHRATRNIDGYSLTVAKGGPKLQQAKPLPETGSGEFDDGYVVGTIPEVDALLVKGHNASVLQLAEFLERSLGTSVLDRTNLTGKYDFELICSRDPEYASPNLLASCIKRAGLAMQKYKGPVEFLVIDHLGKLVEN